MLIWGLDGFIVQIEKDDHFALTKRKRWENESAAMKGDEDEEKVNEGKR
jgi:hypothetical protein